MVRPLQAHGKRSKVYGPGLLAIFRKKYTKKGIDRLEFTIDELRAELVALGVAAANLPDLIYRMKSRTILPDEIMKAGFKILRIKNRGVYELIKGAETLVAYPEPTTVETIRDVTPAPVRRLLPPNIGSIDEQGFLSVLRYNDMFTKFLGVRTYHFKSHVRKSVPGVGQAEVDDVHIAASDIRNEALAVVPVEAKAKDDPVNRAQIAMQIHYAQHAFPGLMIRPLTVKMFDDGLILFMEFNATIEPNELRVVRHAHYRLVNDTLPV